MFESFAKIIKQNLLAGLLLIIGIICIGIGFTQIEEENKELQNITEGIKKTTDTSSIPIPLETSKPQQTPIVEQYIFVDIQGAVTNPGVYKLLNPARVSDALTQAGDTSIKADTLWLAKNLNRAQLLNDGDKLYIPFKGEVKSMQIVIPTPTILNEQNQIGYIPASSAPKSESSTQKENTTAQPNSKISINNASHAELDSLDGIGQVRAQKIIDNRPYTTLDELVQKKVLYKSTFEKIKDDIEL
jgi:competence protein ComEA